MSKKEEKKSKKQERPKPKTWYGKLWYFIWYDDSILSWIVNIILAVILIKFIVYPGLGLIFGTNFPVVAVVSNSMEHKGNFDRWWESNGAYYENIGITKDNFKEFYFKNGFNKGDIIVLFGKKPSEINVGDVIVFQSQKSYPIIHRVINKKISAFETKGDNNNEQIREYININTRQIRLFLPSEQIPSNYISILDETNVSHDALLGKAVFRIPYVGYLKIWAVDFLHLFGIKALG